MVTISTKGLNIDRNTLSTGNVVRISKDFNSNKSASPRLINWVEPVVISGYEKTIFYTEIDSNLKKGDKVFIINGNYDASTSINSNKFKTGRDGYKILDIDRCKITLDIDYTGVLPWVEDDFDNFIKVHYVKSQREFDYVNRQFISRDSFSNKFNTGQNNFIFVSGTYSGSSNFGAYEGVTQSGFYCRVDGVTASWTNITSNLLANSLTASYLSTVFTNNGRIFVVNGNFTYGGMEWKDSCIYSYGTSSGVWSVDPKYTRPFVTKSNFRGGNFKGTWNKGIFGSYDNKIVWYGTQSYWQNGSVINTEWRGGAINSILSPIKSYFTEFDEFGLPVQKDNITNNRGYGYNYFINMDFSGSVINNGNFINCNVGLTGSTFSASDKFYQNWSSETSNVINGGDFTSCNFESSSIQHSVIKNSRTNNSYVYDTKSMNSYFDNAVFYKSSYNSDSLIKILGYNEWNAHIYSNSTKQKIYKFYISEADYFRMKSLDKFSIKGLELGVSDYWTLQYNKVLNFFDRGFILDSYSDYDDVPDSTTGPVKYPIDFVCKLSTKAENKYTISSYYIGGTYSTATYSLNEIQLPSVDIIATTKTWGANSLYNFFENNDYNSPFADLGVGGTVSVIGSNIDVTNAYIIDSCFNSGLFENSNWNSGFLYNYNSDTCISGNLDIGQYAIATYSSTQIAIQTLTASVSDSYFKVGDIVYLNSVDYNNSYTITRLPNLWKVDDIISGTYIVSEYLIGTTSTILSTLTSSGVFLTSPKGLTSGTTGTNRYNQLHKVRINNSTIKSGILRRSFISNSTIKSDVFDNSDYLFNDKKKLKDLIILDSIFSDNGNSIKSALISNSYLNEGTDMWYNGILWRSIWESGLFNNGVVKESNWKNGSFGNGIFYQNKSSLSYNSFFSNLEFSYYKTGTGTSSNNRFTWEDGIFNNGQFYESVWEKGVFNNGKFYKSTWVDGSFNNGIFGDDKFNLTDNNFYGGTFSNGIVINSNFYSGGTYSTGFNGINWKNGVFQSGIFGNKSNNPSTWTDGTFNGGDFTNTAVWLNGTFNGGKFTSYYGNTYSLSNTQSQYSWQNGILNGGEFGTGDGLTNSTWWNGEMHGGIFKGKLWNNGLLSSGEFQGGSTYSSVGGASSSNASLFTDSFSSSYYGLWRNGFVTETKDKYTKDKEFSTIIERSSDELDFSTRVNNKKAIIKNSLWMSGTFSHRSGEMNNCVWLDGTFEDGLFKSSSFNPYVKRSSSPTASFNLDDNSCVWKDGTFEGGDFHISVWEKGKFMIGTAYGMLWRNGTSNYMNAFNICWEDGLWRNGNWYGSSFEFNGQVTDDFTRQILFRVMNDCTGTSSCHIWNIFDDNASDYNTSVISGSASTPESPFLPA